jgi:hypothetical protein
MYFHTPGLELAIFRWLNDSIRKSSFRHQSCGLSAPEFLWILALVGACHGAPTSSFWSRP